jgi:hypothetical protein
VGHQGTKSALNPIWFCLGSSMFIPSIYQLGKMHMRCNGEKNPNKMNTYLHTAWQHVVETEYSASQTPSKHKSALSKGPPKK